MVAIAAIMVDILAAIFNMVTKTHNTFRSAPFGSHLKNGYQNDRHFEIALVTITFL
jgi:hypothetical protein